MVVLNVPLPSSHPKTSSKIAATKTAYTLICSYLKISPSSPSTPLPKKEDEDFVLVQKVQKSRIVECMEEEEALEEVRKRKDSRA